MRTRRAAVSRTMLGYIWRRNKWAGIRFLRAHLPMRARQRMKPFPSPRFAWMFAPQPHGGPARAHRPLNDPTPMPELPEVETTRRGVAPRVVGRRIASVDVYDRRLRWPVPPDLANHLVGRTIDAVDRRSKYLLFHIGEGTLLVHLGMTGSLRVYTSAISRVLHDHVDIGLENGTVLRYHDPRRFGAMLWLTGPALAHRLLRTLGPEPFDPAFDAAYFWRATRSRAAAIKLVLMDNHVVVGAGNI